jgi:hypothetical protein
MSSTVSLSSMLVPKPIPQSVAILITFSLS